MKKNTVLLMLFMCMSITAFAQETDQKKTDKQQQTVTMEADIIKEAEAAKKAFIKENKAAETYFNDAIAYAIFPNVGKGAFVVGVASGQGAVYQKGKLIGLASMKQVDVGAQVGGEAYQEAIFFNSEEAFERFKNDEFEFTAGVSAVILQSGKALDAEYREGVAVVVKPKAGLMIEASVGGQKFEFTPVKQ